jgi:hypothetical protein
MPIAMQIIVINIYVCVCVCVCTCMHSHTHTYCNSAKCDQLVSTDLLIFFALCFLAIRTDLDWRIILKWTFGK